MELLDLLDTIEAAPRLIATPGIVAAHGALQLVFDIKYGKHPVYLSFYFNVVCYNSFILWCG